MPLPKPMIEETDAEFISRCFFDPTMENEYSDESQRIAVCYAQLDEYKQKEQTFADYPKTAREQARRALEHKKEHNSKCGTAVGWARARQLASGEALSLRTLKRTYSFLSRAQVYDKGRFFDEDGAEICGSVMYAAWGGDTMLNWCERQLSNEQ